MAKIVELSGSPGVGKTSIYREINGRWKKKYSWIPAHYLCPHPSFSLEYVRQFLSYLPKKMKGKAGGTFYDLKMEARKRFVEKYSTYMDLCWKDLVEKQKKTLNGLDLRLRKAELLGEQIETIQFLKDSETNQVAILEEGLIHLIDVLGFHDTYEEIKRVIDVMPLPDAVIYIETDVSENVRRLMKRGEFISIHSLLSKEQLHQITKQSHKRRILINNILEERKIPLLHVDAREPIKANADKILSFIENV